MTAAPTSPPRLRDVAPIATAGSPTFADTFVGTWRNTLDSTDGLARVDVVRRGEDLAIVTTDGQGEQIDWGSDVQRLIDIAPGRPIAFSVEKDFGDHTGLLQGNLNLNLLVLGTYKTPKDGGVGYFSREFFIREPTRAPTSKVKATSGELFSTVTPPAVLDTHGMVGRWRNTEDPTVGIQEIEILAANGGLEVEVTGSGENPWGRAEVGIYAAVDEGGHKTFSVLADYRRSDWVSRLQLRLPGGALAVASFNTFPENDAPGQDDPRPDYFTREFFYRRD